VQGRNGTAAAASLAALAVTAPHRAVAALYAAGASALSGSAATVATGATGGSAAAACAATGSAGVWSLGLFFLKIGCILYGGGYVLIAYLRGELVGAQYGLTEQQLLDAIAIGQLTPGPILSTATFVGYQIADWPGAIVATLGIFLPSFVLVAILNPIVPKLRRHRITSLALDSVNAVSIGLLLAVTVELSLRMLLQIELAPGFRYHTAGTPDWRDWLIAAAALAAVFRWRVSPAWIVLAGGTAGWMLKQ
jgi:chromate transporter